MSSIESKDIVRKILENNGTYPGDPTCQSVYEYETMFDSICYKLCFNEAQEANFLTRGTIRSAMALFRNGSLTPAGEEWLASDAGKLSLG